MTQEDLAQLFSDFTGGPPASPDVIALLEQSLRVRLPPDFRDFLGMHDGAAGFVGDNYVILWSAGEVARYHGSYQVNEYAPGLVLFGSNGGGEAYAFDRRTEANAVVMVPFVGMSLEYAKPVAPTFLSFLDRLRGTDASRTDPRRGSRRALTPRGKEIFEVHPVILGGSPVDQGNKVVLTREQHIEAVRYWNGIVLDLRMKSHR